MLDGMKHEASHAHLGLPRSAGALPPAGRCRCGRTAARAITSTAASRVDHVHRRVSRGQSHPERLASRGFCRKMSAVAGRERAPAPPRAAPLPAELRPALLAGRAAAVLLGASAARGLAALSRVAGRRAGAAAPSPAACAPRPRVTGGGGRPRGGRGGRAAPRGHGPWLPAGARGPRATAPMATAPRAGPHEVVVADVTVAVLVQPRKQRVRLLRRDGDHAPLQEAPQRAGADAALALRACAQHPSQHVPRRAEALRRARPLRFDVRTKDCTERGLRSRG